MVPSELRSPAVVVICGPTGSGKGALAREVALRLDGEIVSADSRKVYRRMDVGTAKPDQVARSRTPHHLIDVAEPGEVFSAARFVKLADRAMADILGRKRLPVVAGGTGLYIRALLHGIIETPPRDDGLRRRLQAEERRSPGCLHARLEEIDRESAARIPPGDVVRLVRALEVFELTGRPLSRFQSEHGFGKRRFRAFQAAIDWPRDELDARIDRRVHRLLQAGWLAETEALLCEGALKALEVVGYRQLRDHLDGRCSLEEAIESIQRAHRRYARQQLKWFRAVDDLRWLPAPVDVDGLEEELREFLADQW